MSRSGELQAKVERLVRASNQTINAAALMASIIQAQRDYATRKYFHEFKKSHRLADAKIKLRFEQQTAKAHSEREFMKNRLKQANRQTERMHQESKELKNENTRLFGMYCVWANKE